MTDYVLAVPELPENLRIRIPADIKDDFTLVCEKKNLSKQGAIERLLRCWLLQDDVVQSMMVGQIDPTGDLAELIVNAIIRQPRRMAAKIRPKPKDTRAPEEP